MGDRDDGADGEPEAVPPFPTEQSLIELLPEVDGRRILCTSLGRAQLARSAATARPDATVHCHFLDVYRAELARLEVGDLPANLTIACAADFPEAEFDLAALPFTARGEAELTRDLMQAAHQRLAIGGTLIVSTDNPRDTWLHAEMRKLFDAVARRDGPGGVAYVARKARPLKKPKDFSCEFAFRDRGRLIFALSRPGVFSHRSLDGGARQLLNAMEVAAGERVVDIGCGSGAVALAAAARAEGVQVLAVDSHARAVACTEAGARRNGLAGISALLNARGDYPGPGTFDLALANPPYYAAFRIARLFALAAREALRPGGRLLLVTKLPDWYARNLPGWFDDVRVEESRGYHLIRGRRPGGPQPR